MKDHVWNSFFPDEEERKQKRECGICKDPVNFMKLDSDLSLKIYRDENLCKDCQESIFGKDYAKYFFPNNN